jgi:hypothetical protein
MDCGAYPTSHAAVMLFKIGGHEHDAETTAGFPDAGAIDVHLQERSHPRNRDRTGATTITTNPLHPISTRSFAWSSWMPLAGTIRLGHCVTYSAAQAAERIARSDRRFIRQLACWLDVGGPVPPPVEDTLADLPRRPRSPWSAARERYTVGPWVLADVWLTRHDPTGPITAHMVQRAVGTIGDSDSHQFDHVMRRGVLRRGSNPHRTSHWS